MNKVIKIIIDVILILAIVLLIIYFALRITGKIKIYNVETGSMEDKIHAGDYILLCRKDNYKVGDVVRINNDQHSVIILKIDSSMEQITIAEGNYGETIHWGRTFKFQSMNSVCNYILRRNPS